MKLISKARTALFAIIDDILVVAGLLFLLKATFTWSNIAGTYLLGAILLVAGLFYAKNTPKT